MSTGVKIVLGLLVLGLVGGAVLCGGGYLWLENNKDGLVAMGEEQIVAGEAFGSTTEQIGCIDEGLAKQDTCGDFDPMCEAGNGIWLKACLGVASESPGLCDGVPSKSDIIDSATWAVGTCGNMGRPQDQPCGRLLQQVQEHCHGPL
ncbi:MAG: hypothetical protein GY913_09120 [Proteobacteria bacterium]|nr:hypothetical protein [Pseudomonadota bacterium]MCP4917072.1 hypothetical protein [Pseudomonadota bacterium]